MKSYIRFDGPPGSTVITDDVGLLPWNSGENGVTISNNKGVNDSGTSAFFMDGPCNQQFLCSSAIPFGNSDFTIEAFINIANINTCFTILDQRSNYNNNGILLGIYKNGSTNILGIEYHSSAGYRSFSTYTQNIPLNEWVHVTICRKGDKLRSFVNGTKDGDITVPINGELNTARYILGNVQDRNCYYNARGYIGWFRVTMAARYEENFTIPSIPILPFDP